MGQVLEFKRRVFSGAEADMAAVPSPAVADIYVTTDSEKTFYYNGAAWESRQLKKMIDHTWEGDNAHNREIDLGDDYDYIEIFCEESFNRAQDHLVLATAFKTFYGALLAKGTSTDTGHYSMASVDVYYQGKMAGGDVNKIKLGSAGDNPQGTNLVGNTYRLIGFKFQDMI